MIICCGEALIDMLPRQLEDGSNVFLPVSGGALFNTAIALGRLGADTGFISGISNDMFGDQLIASLEESNVSSKYCVRSDQPSTLAFVVLTDGQAHYSFFDENSAGRMLSVESLPTITETIEALHFGCISLIPEPCGATYEALLVQHHQTSVISLDPNIRPGFINNPESHRGRIQRMTALSDIVKVSDEDLDWMTAGADGSAAIQSWLDAGTSIVVLTKGADGCEVFTPHGTISAKSIPTEVVDTVGAGDSFNAGMLNGLKTRDLLSKEALAEINLDVLRDIVGEAVKVASITVSRAGANPPWHHEL